MLGLGLAIPDLARRGGLDPACAALIARMTATPGAARIGRIDALIRALKSSGVWPKIEALWLLAAQDAQAARLNWKAAELTLAPVNAPAFTIDRGYSGDGANSFLDTGLNLSASGIFQTASASMGCWTNSGSALSGKYDMGAISGSDGCLVRSQDLASGAMLGRINQTATQSAGAVASPIGFSAFSRTSMTLVTGYRDGVATGTFSDAASARPASPLALCAITSNGAAASHSSNRLAAAFVGAGLSASEMAALHAALRTYLTAIGAA